VAGLLRKERTDGDNHNVILSCRRSLGEDERKEAVEAINRYMDEDP